MWFDFGSNFEFGVLLDRPMYHTDIDHTRKIG